jgi:hypothetical protein
MNSSTNAQSLHISPDISPLISRHRYNEEQMRSKKAMVKRLKDTLQDSTSTDAISQSADQDGSWHNNYEMVVKSPIVKTEPIDLLEYFEVRQKWLGCVQEVQDDCFVAHLTSLAGDDGEHIAEIFLEELDDEDRSSLEPGSYFYWSIGYINKPSGRVRSSLIRLRRLPLWQQEEIQRAKAEADKLAAIFDD